MPHKVNKERETKQKYPKSYSGKYNLFFFFLISTQKNIIDRIQWQVQLRRVEMPHEVL